MTSGTSHRDQIFGHGITRHLAEPAGTWEGSQSVFSPSRPFRLFFPLLPFPSSSPKTVTQYSRLEFSVSQVRSTDHLHQNHWKCLFKILLVGAAPGLSTECFRGRLGKLHCSQPPTQVKNVDKNERALGHQPRNWSPNPFTTQVVLGKLLINDQSHFPIYAILWELFFSSL